LYTCLGRVISDVQKAEPKLKALSLCETNNLMPFRSWAGAPDGRTTSFAKQGSRRVLLPIFAAAMLIPAPLQNM
jgi:hypothetical protein